MVAKVFLTAEWRHLLMLNFKVDPKILEPLVPKGTQLDLFRGDCYVSMVGFMFLNTKVKGLPIPFHRHFEEVNLRFYVKRKVGKETRRGVVFVKELVPKFAIAWLARVLYNENYVSLPMSHAIDADDHGIRLGGRVEYKWRFKGKDCHMAAMTSGEPYIPSGSSVETFISEHYYGYARQKDGSTVEYEVQHPQWQVLKVQESSFHCNVAALYGRSFEKALSADPASAFVAVGSPIKVLDGLPLEKEEDKP